MLSPVLGKLVNAIREIFADLRSEMNDIIYQQLDDRHIEYQKGFDFYRLIENLVRRSGLDEDKQEEVIQEILTQMFSREDRKSIFDLYDPAKSTKLERWFYTAVQRRILNALEKLKTHGRERPTDFQPGDAEEANPWGIDRFPAKPEQLEDPEYKELVEDLTNHLSKHRLGETLVKIFNMLLDGWTKQDIANQLGFKSASRLTYYLVELQEAVKTYVRDAGDESLARALTKVLGHP